jgi:hypothetical protein
MIFLILALSVGKVNWNPASSGLGRLS